MKLFFININFNKISITNTVVEWPVRGVPILMKAISLINAKIKSFLFNFFFGGGGGISFV